MANPDKPTYTHGSTGTEPANPIDYSNGDPLNADNLDYYLYTEFNKLKAIIDTLNEIDGDGDGIVDEADTVTAGGNLNGDLTALDGETIWDESAGYIPISQLQYSILTVAGNDVGLGGSTGIALGDLSNVTASGEGSGNGLNADEVDGQDFGDIQTWVNNNADVPNADHADSATNADTADSATDADTVSGPDGTQHQAGSLPRFADEATGLNNTNEGDLFYNNANNSVYLNDGT